MDMESTAGMSDNDFRRKTDFQVVFISNFTNNPLGNYQLIRSILLYAVISKLAILFLSAAFTVQVSQP